MHKTEVTHLNKRLETQIDMKEKQIQSLEERVRDLKDKNNHFETLLTEK